MLTGIEYLTNKVKQTTGVNINVEDLVFSNPVKLNHGETRNTLVMVFPRPWIPLITGYEFRYNRIHYSDISTFVIYKTQAKSVYDILDTINNKYELRLNIKDVIDTPLPQEDVDGRISFRVKINENSHTLYDGEIVRTITEFIDLDNPPPPPPVDPEIPAITLSDSIADNTLLRTMCKGDDLWAIYGHNDGSITEELQFTNDSSCSVTTLSNITPVTYGKAAGFCVSTYAFNKLSTVAVSLKARLFSVTGVVVTTDILQYKTQESDNWTTVTVGGEILIPAGTYRFSIRAKIKDTQTTNLFLYLVESNGFNVLANTEPLVTQIVIDGAIGSLPPPPVAVGTYVDTYCIGYKKYNTYADGIAGIYSKLINELSTDCGYVIKPVLSVDILAFTLVQTNELILTYALSQPLTVGLELGINFNHITTVPENVDVLEYKLTADTDYTAITINDTFIIPAGDTAFSVKVKFKDDTIIDDDKYVTLRVLELGVNALLGNETSVGTNITITN